MSTKNLSTADAIIKLKEFVDSNATCFFCTNIADGKFDTRPMSSQQVDDEGNVWFLSKKGSDKDFDIKRDDKVQLLYSLSSHSGFMSVQGKATTTDDQAKIDELWTPIAKVWFPEGKEDPSISVIKVTTDGGYYWDTEHGKVVSFIKMAASLVTGETKDDGVQGTMSL
ncbi:pyridoxamine 5'-phosphate oxidase family protein [Flavipsychrobacter stenotrophus]|nr:pyridoxamine 5'-phosphate oxidase family protein [Flavipsychrobacter stenotrophus]